MMRLALLAFLVGCGGSLEPQPPATPDGWTGSPPQPPALCVFTDTDRTKGIGLSDCGDGTAVCYGELSLVNCVVWPGQAIERLCVEACE